MSSTPPEESKTPPARERHVLTTSARRKHEGLTLLVGTGIAIVLGLILFFAML